jgi:4-aminobutyrate---pyruvate transaminase
VAVALKTLEIYRRERIVDRVARNAPQFQQRLRQLNEHPLVGQTRGLGLIGAAELVADKRTKRSFEAKNGVGARAVRCAEDEGVLLRSLGADILALCPPLVIDAGEIDELFDRLTRALDRTLDWVRNEGIS